MTHLRNLNRPGIRGRVLGTPYVGVLGSEIPSTGLYGPSYLYNDLAPEDMDKRISGPVTLWPSTGNLKVFENGEFEFTPAQDGSEYFEYQLKVLDVPIGSPTRVDLVSGAGATTINAFPANALAAGATASLNRTIQMAVANALAEGSTASITSQNTIIGNTGNAFAAGLDAVIQLTQTISATTGNALAEGLTATINTAGGVTIDCGPGDAVANGLTALIQRQVTIMATVGNAEAAGKNATVTNASMEGRTLTQADVDAIVAAIWAHPFTEQLLTVIKFVGLK